VLEESFELIEIAAGDRQKLGAVCFPLVGARDRPNLDLEVLTEALDPPSHAYELTALEAAGENVRVTKGTREDRSRLVPQLDRQVRAAGA
jgi:hypothetical protein